MVQKSDFLRRRLLVILFCEGDQKSIHHHVITPPLLAAAFVFLLCPAAIGIPRVGYPPSQYIRMYDCAAVGNRLCAPWRASNGVYSSNNWARIGISTYIFLRGLPMVFTQRKIAHARAYSVSGVLFLEGLPMVFTHRKIVPSSVYRVIQSVVCFSRRASNGVYPSKNCARIGISSPWCAFRAGGTVSILR